MKINVILRDVNIDFKRLDGDFAGVDRGVYSLISSGIIPQFAYGDFDSVNDEELAIIKNYIDINVIPAEKDYTDTELALFHLVSAGYTEINVYGALGDRIDHEFMNVQLLLHEDLIKHDIRYVNESNELFVIHEKTKLKRKGYKYVSFIPVHDKTQLKLSGFKYDGTFTTHIGSTLTVSNEFRQAYSTVDTDCAIIVIYSNDRRMSE